VSVGVPVQVPLPPVRVWPSWGVPEIVGGEVLAGGRGTTTDDCGLTALSLPASL
jgi:hypothetical protein